MRRRLALATGAVSLVLAAVSVVLILLTPEMSILGRAWGFRGYDALFAVAFTIVGLIISLARPGNVIGLLLVGAGLQSGIQTATDSYATYAALRGLPGEAVIGWVSQWSWLSGIALVSLLLQAFPTGRTLPGWGRLARLTGVVAIAVTALWALAPPVGATPYATWDPLGLPVDSALRTVTTSSTLLLVLTLVIGFASLITRMRVGPPIVRQQIKWVALSGVLIAVALSLTVVATAGGIDPALAKPIELLNVATIPMLAVAVAIAVLRYRLYEIDVLINRTIVYVALSAALALSFVVIVVLLQAGLRPLTGGSELAVAASTLATVALAQPLRRRIQDAVDRRFYRSRYDAVRALDAFSGRLRGEVDLSALRSDMLDVVRDTVRPAHAGVWLRGETT